MSSTYEILEFGSLSETAMEPMGTKEKYWVERDTASGEQEWFFKLPRAATGEAWAEKAAAELARLIDLPAATVELATLEIGDQLERGTACLTFAPSGLSLVHGNEMLETTVSGYDRDKRYGQKQHSLDAILKAISDHKLEPPVQDYKGSAQACFAGYIVFDGWIANVDRHHENWGMLRNDFDRLAPSYDHASSLGRLLSDDRRSKLLKGEIYRLDLEKFLSRSKAGGAIYPPRSDDQVPPWKLVGSLAEFGLEDAAREWLGRIAELDQMELVEVFERFPSGWISAEAVEFALAVLEKTTELMKAELNP